MSTKEFIIEKVVNIIYAKKNESLQLKIDEHFSV